jgi:hypothetical protein
VIQIFTLPQRNKKKKKILKNAEAQETLDKKKKI